jgi:23S rRNA (adenine2503-C2)-methyltransferase
MDQAALTALVESIGEKSFRGKQLYYEIYRRLQTDFEAMTELSKSFRLRLAEAYSVDLPAVDKRLEAEDDTVKYLFRLADGKTVEGVFIPEEGRDTLCISSQVGCNLGCRFCLTAQMGLQRNLSVAEILGQVIAVVKERSLRKGSYSIVFMGMGEPLQNYKNVMKAFRLMVDPLGMGLSHRKVTISTAGLAPVLRRMQEATIFPNLAVSLNAVSDELRDELMPVNRRWNLKALLQACAELPVEPRRRLMFEYVMIKGLSDSDHDAHRLARLLRGFRPKVNLIPFNPSPGLPYERPSEERIQRFRDILVNEQIAVFMRKPRGGDISAACGQLACREHPATVEQLPPK